MSREALEKLRASYAEIDRSNGKLPDMRNIEQRSTALAEQVQRERGDAASRKFKDTPPTPSTTTYIDRYGKKLTEKE